MGQSTAAVRLFLTGLENNDFGANTPNDGNITIQSTVKRTGTYALRLQAQSGTNSRWTLGLWDVSSPSDLFFRGYLRVAALPSTRRIIACTSTSHSSLHPAIALNPDGTISLLSNSTVVGTTTTALQLNTWYRIEWAVNSTAASSALQIDGVMEIGWTSVSVTSSGLAQIVIGAVDTVAATMDLYWDDLAIDAAGWPGPGRVVRLAITGPGSITASGFTVSGATSKWEAVSELGTDNETSYVTTDNNTTSREVYTFENLPAQAVAVRGVCAWVRHQRDGGSNGTIALTAYLDGRTADIAGFSTASSWAWRQTTFYSSNHFSPIGGGWTVSRVNDLEIGIKEGSSSNRSRYSTVVLEVDYDDTEGAETSQFRGFLEGFEHGEVIEGTASGTVSVQGTIVRSGSYALRVNPSGNTASFWRSPAFSTATINRSVFIRVYVYVTTRPSSGNTMRLLSVRSSSGSLRAAVRMDSAGAIQLEDTTGLIGSASDPGVIPTGQWVRLEVFYLTSTTSTASDGRLIVRVNEDEILTNGAVRTSATTFNNEAVTLGTTLAPGSGGCDVAYDDFVYDFSDWVGDSRVTMLLPTGAGQISGTGFAAVGATNQWECLVDVPPDDDTTYVTTGTSTTSTGSYQTGNLPAIAVYVRALAVVGRTRRDGGSNGSVGAGFSTNGKLFTRTTSGFSSGASYSWGRRHLPWSITDGAWTKDLVNNGELAITNHSSNVSRVTSLRAIVEYTALEATEKIRELTADGYVVEERTRDLSADALVEGSALLGADAVVQTVETRELGADAHVVFLHTPELAADALVTGSQVLPLSTDALVQGTIATELGADGYVTDDQVRDLTTDALVQQTPALDLAGDAAVLAEQAVELAADARATTGFVEDQTVELTADGFVVPLITRGKLLDADGWVQNPSVRTRNLNTDAYVLSWPELTADAVVTAAVGSARLVAFSNGSWEDPIWRVVSGERVDGTVFADPSQTFPFIWSPGFVADAVALAVAIDLRSGNGGSVTFSLEEDTGVWTERTSVTLVYADWSAYRVPNSSSAHPTGWLLLPLPAPVTLSGAAWRVVATRTGDAPDVLSSLTQVNQGQGARVLNCLVVTDEVMVPDGRPVMVLGQVSGGGILTTGVTVGGLVSADTVLIGPGGTLIFDPATETTFTVSRLLHIGSGGALTMEPAVGVRHLIQLGTEALIRTEGSWTMTGHAKTRAADLASSVLSTDSEITLSEPPTGWLEEDRLYVAATDGGEGNIVTIAGINGATVTLTTNVGQNVAAGGLVLNISRTAAIHGPSATNRGAIAWGQVGTTSWTHVELARMGRPDAVAPSGKASASFSDLVVCEGRIKGGASGATGIRLPTSVTHPATITCTDLTLVRCHHGLVAETKAWTLGGTTYVAGFIEPDGAIISSSFHLVATVVGQDLRGGLVGLADGASRVVLTGEHRWAHAGGALVAVRAQQQAWSAIIKGGSITSIDELNPTAIVTIRDGGFLGRLQIENVTSDAPAVYMERMARGLLNGTVERSTITARSLARLDGFDRSHMIDLVGKDLTIPVLDNYDFESEGTIAPGSRLANQMVTETYEGSHQQDTTVYRNGAASMLVTSYGSAFTLVDDYEVELLPVPVLSTVEFWVTGNGTATFRLGDDEVLVTMTGVWTRYELTGTGALRVIAHGGTPQTQFWIDDIVVI